MPRIKATEVAPGRFLPMLDIEIRVPVARAQMLGLVDSGADLTIVPGQVLEAIGVPWTSLKKAGDSVGAGGGFETRIAKGAVLWEGSRIREQLLVAQPGALPWPLIGRDDFFKKHVVRFSWHRQPPTIDIDPVASTKR